MFVKPLRELFVRPSLCAAGAGGLRILGVVRTGMTIVWLTICAGAMPSNAMAQDAAIAEWNFNSTAPDGSIGTGTLKPSVGQGTAGLVGGVNSSFAGGDALSDPAGSDNSGWNTMGYPAAGTNNRTAGVRFDVDTVGFQSIQVTWSERHSGTASKWVRMQYTTDGQTFADWLAYEMQSTFTNYSADFSAVPGVADNSLFGFRIVTEWESTATGGGAEAFVPTSGTSSYGTSGTIRFDLVSVRGRPMPGGNTPPLISAIADEVLRVHGATNIPFTVTDAQDISSALAVGVSWSAFTNASDTAVSIGGTGAYRWVHVAPGSQAGAGIVTITARDTGGRTATRQFAVTILPANTAPELRVPTHTNMVAGSIIEIPVSVSDAETPAGALPVVEISETPSLLPDDQISVSGMTGERWLRVVAPKGSSGIATVALTVSDGLLAVTKRIGVLITPSDTTLLTESFEYGPGALINASPYWGNRSGTEGTALVTNGALALSAKRTEDVAAPLGGGAVRPGSNSVVYAGFSLIATAAFTNKHGLLAHFGDGSTLRGRVYVSSTNAGPGRFRLLVANGAGGSVEWPGELQIGKEYRVVTRYDVDAASTSLWVNPADESEAASLGSDSQTAARILNYGFRQDSDTGGEFLVDNLRVATSFAEANQKAEAGAVLKARREAGMLVLEWEASGYRLQSAPSAAGEFTDLAVSEREYRVAPDERSRFFRLVRESQ